MMQRIIDLERRVEAIETRVLHELGDAKREIVKLQGLTTTLTQHVLAQVNPPRDPEDSLSIEVERGTRSQRQSMARSLARKSDPDAIERDLQGFERTVLRSFVVWRKWAKWIGWVLAGAGVVGHLILELYQRFR